MIAGTTNDENLAPAASATDAREERIREHMGMARRLARKVCRRLPPTANHEELESAAYLGLAEAAARFDPSRGEPFVAFAAKRIRGAIFDELRRADALTRRGREGARRIQKAAETAEKRRGGPVDSEDVAGELGISADELSRERGKFENAKAVSFDELLESPAADSEEAPDRVCARAQEKTALASAISALSERDQLVLSLYYRDDLTLKEIGEVLGITESRVCQIRSRTLCALRAAIADA